MVQNMRGTHPGFDQRAGQIKQHSTAYGTEQVMSLYNFSKGRRSENHLLAQMGDGVVKKATNLPPTVTSGAFGSTVFTSSGTPIPASFTSLDDKLLYANGVDYHQLWPGTTDVINKFVVYSSASALPDVPTTGIDYSDQVTYQGSATSASIGTLGTNPTTDCIAICCPVMPSTLFLTIGTANTNVRTMTAKYWKGSWSSLTITDNTAQSSKTLAQTGSVTWTAVTDALPKYMFGKYGFWVLLFFSGALSSPTITLCEYSSGWQSIINMWDGVAVDVVEAQVYTASGTTYSVYGGSSISIGGLTSSDAIYLFCADPVEAFYFDVGSTPNTTASTTISGISYGTGTTFTSVGSYTDNTAGLSKSGWVVIPRNAAKPMEFNNSQYYAYIYKIVVDKTLSDDINIGVQYIPVYDITELGKSKTVGTWKQRGVFTFDRFSDYLYITRENDPQGFNGSEYGIIQAGDGRGNAVVATRSFYNELLVWQQERGEAGGCLTLIEGYSPVTYGKLLLSSRLGAMNNKCVAIVDGVTVSTATQEVIKTLAFALSRYGIYCTDGKSCWMIDHDISNYFDPTKSESIRSGYENQMWLAYDSAYRVIRVGLVSGNSATVPNVFPVFDLVDKSWSFDVLGQTLSTVSECGAGSGQDPVVQIGGGTGDGTVYILNSGTNDVDTAVDSFATMEIDAKGLVVNLREMVLRFKDDFGSCTVSAYVNGILKGEKVLT
jgi:hypothetical protein